MVWDANGYLFAKGAIDFAGGTVVHINAGIAALVGCIVIGKRVGYGKDNMAPHSMVLTMVGASMLWVGWFGFNVGSNLEANGGATLAMINTFIATAAATRGLGFAGNHAARQGVDAGCGFGHGDGSCGRHPGLRHHRPDGGDPAWVCWRRWQLLLRHRGQAQDAV